jgi:STE24 endopeptidase
LSFVFTLLTPLLVTPLFYEVRPLAEAGLRARILALADRAGMRVNDVYVIDASSKTTAANAYFTGFGDARRIVLYDTLLTGYTPDQVEVVLAHEMGHWYYRHVLWGLLGLSAAGWLGLFGLRWLLWRTCRPLGLRSPADVAGLPYLMAIIAIVTILSLPIQNGISRWAERQADQFSLTISQKPAAFIRSFEQLAVQNLSMVDAPAWEKFVFYTHPPIVERIQMAESFQENLE